MSARQKTLDEMPPDLRAFGEALFSLLKMYMPGTETIGILVGRNVSATITYKGGPVTREVLKDTIAHLAFYEKYFPKDGDATSEMDSPEKIMESLVTRWQEHRAELERTKEPQP